MLPSVPKMVKTFETVHLLTAERGTGEILSDRKPNGKERPWKTYKRQDFSLPAVRQGARDRRILHFPVSLPRLGTLLLVAAVPAIRRRSVLKLHKAEFCRHRLCPTMQLAKIPKTVLADERGVCETAARLPRRSLPVFDADRQELQRRGAGANHRQNELWLQATGQRWQE